MSVNILNLTKEYLTDFVSEKLAVFVGEDSHPVRAALNGLLPSLLAAVMQKASTPGGAQQVMGLIEQQNPAVLDDLPAMLGNSVETQKLLIAGNKVLPALAGSKIQVAINTITSANALRSSSSASLLSFLTPVLLGVLAKQFAPGEISLSALTGMLILQRDSVISTLPAGLTSLFHFENLGDLKSRGYEPKVIIEKGDGPLKSLLWVLAAVMVLFLVWTMRNCEKHRTAGTTALADSSVSQFSGLTDTLSAGTENGAEHLGAFFKRKLPNGTELNIPRQGIENKLLTFIEEASKPVDSRTWFNFDRINFETGSTKLSAESREQIKNLAEILMAYPNVNLKVGGYTDNTGDAALNLKLSKDRAEAVKRAIESEGIQAERLQAEGYGKQYPVDTNETQQGRAHNRRIAVRVTKK